MSSDDFKFSMINPATSAPLKNNWAYIIFYFDSYQSSFYHSYTDFYKSLCLCWVIYSSSTSKKNIFKSLEIESGSYVFTLTKFFMYSSRETNF